MLFPVRGTSYRLLTNSLDPRLGVAVSSIGLGMWIGKFRNIEVREPEPSFQGTSSSASRLLKRGSTNLGHCEFCGLEER